MFFCKSPCFDCFSKFAATALMLAPLNCADPELTILIEWKSLMFCDETGTMIERDLLFPFFS